MLARIGATCLVALLFSAACEEEGADVPTEDHTKPPAIACESRPGELARPPTDGSLPCELLPPGFAPANE